MEIKKIKIKNERRGPKSEQKMRYFKIPLCRNVVLKVRVYSAPSATCQCHHAMNVCDATMNARRQRHFDWDEKPQWDT